MEHCQYIHPVSGEKCVNIAHTAHHCLKHSTIDVIVPWFERQIRNLEEHNDELIGNIMFLKDEINKLQANQKRARIQWRRAIKQWIKDKVSDW